MSTQDPGSGSRPVPEHGPGHGFGTPGAGEKTRSTNSESIPAVLHSETIAWRSGSHSSPYHANEPKLNLAD